MPDAPGLELIRGEIEQDHPGAVLDTGFEHGCASLAIAPEHLLVVLAWLRDAPGQGYRFLSSLHAADYLPAEPRFAVHYELLNRDRVERLRVKALLRDPAASGSAGKVGGLPAGHVAATNRVGSSESVHSGDVEYPPVGEAPHLPSTVEAGSRHPQSDGVEGEESLLPVIDSCVELFPTAEFQEREVFDFFGIVFRGHPDLRRILLPEDYVGWPQRRDFPVGGEPVTFTYNERDYG